MTHRIIEWLTTLPKPLRIIATISTQAVLTFAILIMCTVGMGILLLAAPFSKTARQGLRDLATGTDTQ